MKALSIWNPHALMLAIGMRRIETRGWQTSYRGRLLIHAAKHWDQRTADECNIAGEQARAVPPENLTDAELRMANRPWGELNGCVLAVATLSDCIPIPEPCGTEWDKAWGGFGPGRFGFALSDVRCLSQPVPARGAQGLWVPSLDLLDDVRHGA